MDENKFPNIPEEGTSFTLTPELLLLIFAVFIIFVVLWYFNSKRRRYHFKFRINYWKYKLGINTYISRRYIGMAHVKDNRDAMVNVLSHPRIIMNLETLEDPILLRKEVAVKLSKVADRLPEGLSLKLYSAFRSRSIQNELWKAAIEETIKENPDMGRAEILKLVRFKASDPKSGLGGHETGGAVDVTLCDAQGNDLDFGTKFHEYNDLTKTHSSLVTAEQAKNRSLLTKMMRKEGFINFPGEWWHFSYGDRSWAAYTGRRKGGIYDSVEKEFEGKYVPVIPIKIFGVETKK